MTNLIDTKSLADMASKIVSAYVMKNSVKATDLPNLISDVHSALVGLMTVPVEAATALVPAVPVRKSITPDFLVCLDDGRKFKSLRRQIGQLGMTPEGYREKWGLPRDYPMVAPNYSAVRSGLAKSIGLGKKPGASASRTPKLARAKT